MQLVIVRHGKAEHDSPTGRDEDRPLARHGRDQIHWLGKHLLREKFSPQFILASGHLRAMATAQLLAEALDRPLQREPLLELGHSSSDVVGLLDLLAQGRWPRTRDAALAPDGPVERLMLVGHNPQLERLAAVLLSGPSGNHGPPLHTGEAIVLDLSAVVPGNATLVATYRLPGD